MNKRRVNEPCISCGVPAGELCIGTTECEVDDGTMPALSIYIVYDLGPKEDHEAFVRGPVHRRSAYKTEAEWSAAAETDLAALRNAIIATTRMQAVTQAEEWLRQMAELEDEAGDFPGVSGIARHVRVAEQLLVQKITRELNLLSPESRATLEKVLLDLKGKT